MVLSEGGDVDLLENLVCLSILMMRLRDFLKDVVILSYPANVLYI